MAILGIYHLVFCFELGSPLRRPLTYSSEIHAEKAEDRLAKSPKSSCTSLLWANAFPNQWSRILVRAFIRNEAILIPRIRHAAFSACLIYADDCDFIHYRQTSTVARHLLSAWSLIAHRSSLDANLTSPRSIMFCNIENSPWFLTTLSSENVPFNNFSSFVDRTSRS